MKQLCTLSLSNTAFKQEFPSNTYSSFSCILNPPIKSRLGKQLCLYLHSIIIPSRFKDPIPQFISINLQQLEFQLSCSSKKYDTIAEVPIDQKASFPLYLEILSQTKNIFDLNQITKLHFVLTDENEEKIQLKNPNSEILINLSIFEMENERKSFSITCWPSLSQAVYPQNKSGLFKTKLEAPLIFNKKWQVGIKSVLLPEKASCIIEKDVWLKCNGLTYTFKDLSCTSDVNKMETELRIWFKKNFGGFNNGAYAFASQNHDIIFGKRGTMENYEIIFSPLLSWIFNLTNEPKEHRIVLQEETEEIIYSGFDMEKLIPTYYEVYSDLIQKNYFGKNLKSFFGFFPNSEDNKVFIYEPKHITYHNLSKNVVNEISFCINSPLNHLFYSSNMKYPKITLIFKKIN